jgi:hypothetical protein
VRHIRSTLKQTGFNFTPDDLALFEALRVKTGILTRIDLLRLALRRLAAQERLDWPPTEKKGLNPLDSLRQIIRDEIAAARR